MAYKLREHQKDFVRFFNASKSLGVLAWHDMGLGKTLSSLHIGMHYCRIHGGKMAIVCPKSIVTVWEDHIREFFKGDFSTVDIIPYSQLKKYADPKLQNKPDYKFLILDECHYLRNLETQRFMFFIGFLSRLLDFRDMNSLRIIALSGTPMINNGSDLYSMHELLSSENLPLALAKFSSKKNYYKWRANFTIRNPTVFGIKYEGIRNEKRLFEMLGKVTHRRKLANCVDMPEMTVQTIDLGLKDDKLLEEVDINNPDAYMSVLEALSRAKTPKLLEFIKEEFVESGKQTIVFSTHKEALRSLKERWKMKVGLITGEQGSKERESILRRFKEGDLQILGITYACGAEGLNLQHCQYAVYHSYPWTSALFEQAQARIHRPGQKDRTIHYVLTSGQCDRGIFYTVMKKKRSINKLDSMMSV